MNVKNAETILNHLGELEEVENMFVDGQRLRHFVRASIRINVLIPLSTGCWIPRKDLPKVWVNIKYEKLQDMCFKCGVIGHDQRGCKEEKEMSSVRRDIPRYGAKLSVPPAKELGLIMEERERWKQRPPERNNPEQTEMGKIFPGALVVQNQEDRGRGSRPNEEDQSERGEGVTQEEKGEEQEESLHLVNREEHPAPPSNRPRRMIRDGPINNLPFFNLRIQKRIPGFPGMAGFRLDTESERRFGEFPWRPRGLEEGDDDQEREGGGRMVTGLDRLGTANTYLRRGEVERREREEKEREEGEKEKIEGGYRGQNQEAIDKGLMGDKLGESTDFSIPQVDVTAPRFTLSSVGKNCTLKEGKQQLKKPSVSDKGMARDDKYNWQKGGEDFTAAYEKMHSDIIGLRSEIAGFF